jgi:ribosomal protein S18 acetylase RimI-like enzyme
VEIREVWPEEYDKAGEVTVEAWRDFYNEDLGSYADKLRDVATRAHDAVVLLAIERADIIGTVTYVPDLSSPFAVDLKDGEAMIRMLSVSPAHKRRGVGRALSLACIDRARGEGKDAIVLHADEMMDASQKLYESLGFRRDPSRSFHPDDQTFLICYVLEF